MIVKTRQFRWGMKLHNFRLSETRFKRRLPRIKPIQSYVTCVKGQMISIACKTLSLGGNRGIYPEVFRVYFFNHT